MSTIMSSEESSHVHRGLLRNRAISFAVGAIVTKCAVKEQSNTGKLPQIKTRTNTSFGRLKQIEAALLNIGYLEPGRADGPAVILLHGSHCDIHSYIDVTPSLASAAPGSASGVDPKKEGCGTVSDPRMYQLIGNKNPFSTEHLRSNYWIPALKLFRSHAAD